jgi:hypothetical protein
MNERMGEEKRMEEEKNRRGKGIGKEEKKRRII